MLETEIFKPEGCDMTMHKTGGGWVAATAFLMTTGAAHSDITPTEAWQGWKDYMTAFGYEITATEAMSGGTLTVTDVAMGFAVPEENMTMSVTLGEMAFSDNGDGSVGVSIPARLPMTMQVSGPEAFEIDATFDTVDFAMTISGDPGASVSAYSATAARIALTDVTVEGTSLSEAPGGAPFRDVSVEMADLAGETLTNLGDLRRVEQKITTGAWSYMVDVVDPEGSNGSFLINGGSESLAMTGTSTLPEGIDMNDMSGALKAGFSVDGGYVFGPGMMEFRVDEDGTVTDGRSQSGGGDLRIVMNESQLMYGGGTNDLSFEIAGGDIPFPVAITMARYGFELMTPVMQSDTPQAFSLQVLLGEFTMSEFIWALFDPAAQLPRDPATIELDLSGMARLFFDLLDPVQMSAVDTDGEVPGELNALSLDALTVSAAGARLTGTGAVEIDNTDTVTYDGMPKPVGSISLNLTGANTLLDSLVALGFLPEDQAMGARMMMGLFAVAGDGPDELNSTIEFTQDGQVLANGQRLR